MNIQKFTKFLFIIFISCFSLTTYAAAINECNILDARTEPSPGNFYSKVVFVFSGDSLNGVASKTDFTSLYRIKIGSEFIGSVDFKLSEVTSSSLTFKSTTNPSVESSAYLISQKDQVSLYKGSQAVCKTAGQVDLQILSLGSTGESVSTLQRILNLDTDTRVSETGPGSPGSETTYFGGATKAAVIKFQQKYGIVPSDGVVGQETRNKLDTFLPSISGSGEQESSATVTSSASSGQESSLDSIELLVSLGIISPDKATRARQAVSGSIVASGVFTFNKDLKEKDNNQDVLVLQKTLNADPVTKVAETGPGSPGSETTYFGGATKAAVIKFQQKYLLEQTGIVDYATRKVLNKIIVEQKISSLALDARPQIVVKANGMTGKVHIASSTPLTITWETRNVTNCQTVAGSQSIAGTKYISYPTTGPYSLTCQSAYGLITGYVDVTVGGNPFANIPASQNNTYTYSGSVTEDDGYPPAYRYVRVGVNPPATAVPTITSVVPATVMNDGVTSVKIIGTGFFDDMGAYTRIYITSSSGVRTPIISKSINTTGTEMTFVVPTTVTVGTYSLRVSNNNGTTMSNSVTLTVTELSPILTTVTPSSVLADATTLVWISGSGFSSTNAKVYLIKQGIATTTINPTSINSLGTEIKFKVPTTVASSTYSLAVSNNGLKMSNLLNFVVTDSASISGVGGKYITAVGPEESVSSFGDSFTSIAVDSQNNPHIIVNSGSQNNKVFNKRTTGWIGSDIARPYGTQTFDTPKIKVDAQNNAWITIQPFISGDTVKSGQAVWKIPNVLTNDSPEFIKVMHVGPSGFNAGRIAVDSYYPNTVFVFAHKGAYESVNTTGDSSITGSIPIGETGEQYDYSIGPRTGLVGIKHGVQSGGGTNPSAYSNSLISSKVTWADYTGLDFGNDAIHPGITADSVNPEKAYFGIVWEGVGFVMNIWNGSGLVRSPGQLILVDDEATKFTRQSPGFAPARGGGAFVCWTHKGNSMVKVAHIDSTGGISNETDVGPGGACSIAVDKEGKIHVAYLANGLKYKVLTTSSTGSSPTVYRTMSSDYPKLSEEKLPGTCHPYGSQFICDIDDKVFSTEPLCKSHCDSATSCDLSRTSCYNVGAGWKCNIDDSLMGTSEDTCNTACRARCSSGGGLLPVGFSGKVLYSLPCNPATDGYKIIVGKTSSVSSSVSSLTPGLVGSVAVSVSCVMDSFEYSLATIAIQGVRCLVLDGHITDLGGFRYRCDYQTCTSGDSGTTPSSGSSQKYTDLISFIGQKKVALVISGSVGGGTARTEMPNILGQADGSNLDCSLTSSASTTYNNLVRQYGPIKHIGKGLVYSSSSGSSGSSSGSSDSGLGCTPQTFTFTCFAGHQCSERDRCAGLGGTSAQTYSSGYSAGYKCEYGCSTPSLGSSSGGGSSCIPQSYTFTSESSGGDLQSVRCRDEFGGTVEFKRSYTSPGIPSRTTYTFECSYQSCY